MATNHKHETTRMKPALLLLSPKSTPAKGTRTPTDIAWMATPLQ